MKHTSALRIAGLLLGAALTLSLAGRARADADATPYVDQWAVCGPFDNTDAKGFDAVYGPEKDMAKGIDVAAQYDCVEGKASWQLGKAADGVLDFLPLFPNHTENVCAYAYCLVKAPKDMTVNLSIGSDDGAKAFLNGKQVYAHAEDRGLTKDEDTADLALKAGDNNLLVKVVQVGGAWALAVRLTKKTDPVDQITFSVGPAAGLITPFVTDWLVVGPWDYNDDNDFDKVLDPEKKLDLDASYDVGGAKAKWTPAKVGDNGALNFVDIFPDKHENTACFTYVTITAPKAVSCKMLLGSDDGVKAWLNGDLVDSQHVARGLTVDQDAVDVKLKAGENKLLVKVLQIGGDWALCVRFAKTSDSLEGVTFSIPKK
jgi:hypothetical protein